MGRRSGYDKNCWWSRKFYMMSDGKEKMETLPKVLIVEDEVIVERIAVCYGTKNGYEHRRENEFPSLGQFLRLVFQSFFLVHCH